mgnify:CR=1 FL=1
MTVVFFMKLLQCAIWGRKFEQQLSAEDFLWVMALAEQQTVTGLVFDLLSGQHTGADRKVVLKYAGKYTKIQRKNQNANIELQDFVNTCRQNAIDMLVVKGQTLGALYPNPLLRISGDIDFLIKDDYSVVKQRIENAFGVTLPEKMIDKEIKFERNKILYELHNSLITFGSRRNQKYWQQLMDEAWQESFWVTIGENRVRTLPPTINATYLFIHIFFHLLREGIGLRQFCDWAVILHAYKNRIDSEQLKCILERLGVIKAYRAFGYILTSHLGLSLSSFPLEITDEDKKWRKIILQDVFKGGNFGKQNHKAKSTFLFKLETVKMAFRNTFRYYSLAPKEVGLLVPRLAKMDLLLLVG